MTTTERIARFAIKANLADDILFEELISKFTAACMLVMTDEEFTAVCERKPHVTRCDTQIVVTSLGSTADEVRKEISKFIAAEKAQMETSSNCSVVLK